MTTSVTNKYGAYTEANLPYFNNYGVADDEYGVLYPDPDTYDYLLSEDGTYLLQENGDKIIL